MLAECDLLQAIALGDDLPALAALVVPAPGADASDVEHAIERCNGRLPDYARIAAWRAVPPFSVANGLLTANGRLRREAVYKRHAQHVRALCLQIESQFIGVPHGVLHETRPGH